MPVDVHALVAGDRDAAASGGRAVAAERRWCRPALPGRASTMRATSFDVTSRSPLSVLIVRSQRARAADVVQLTVDRLAVAQTQTVCVPP